MLWMAARGAGHTAVCERSARLARRPSPTASGSAPRLSLECRGLRRGVLAGETRDGWAGGGAAQELPFNGHASYTATHARVPAGERAGAGNTCRGTKERSLRALPPGRQALTCHLYYT